MSQPPVMRFACPNCGALYELVRVEAESAVFENELACLSCGAALPAQEGQFLLKYFLVDDASRRRRRRSPPVANRAANDLHATD